MSLDDEYDQISSLGKTYITRSWPRFNEATRSLFMQSYDEYGRKKSSADPVFDSIVNIEYSLGIISRCANHPLEQSRKEGVIPEECSDLVIEEIANVINDKVLSKEKMVIQLCLIALRKSQLAWLSWKVGPARKKFSAPKTLMKIGMATLFGISVPAIASYVIWSHLHGTDTQAVFAAYFGWLAWSIYFWIKNIPASDPYEQALAHWELMIGSSNTWLFTGRAALEKFREMQRKDLPIPLLAFELAHLMMKARE